MGLPSKTYIVDEKGNQLGVVLDIEEYRNILDQLEELESIRAFDAAKASSQDVVPFEQAVREIEQQRG